MTVASASLPTNLSRLEIARDLSISANTVSTHIRSIYAKLGVGTARRPCAGPGTCAC